MVVFVGEILAVEFEAGGAPAEVGRIPNERKGVWV
jgi:hypothetical protein